MRLRWFAVCIHNTRTRKYKKNHHQWLHRYKFFCSRWFVSHQLLFSFFFILLNRKREKNRGENNFSLSVIASDFSFSTLQFFSPVLCTFTDIPLCRCTKLCDLVTLSSEQIQIVKFQQNDNTNTVIYIYRYIDRERRDRNRQNGSQTEIEQNRKQRD